MTRNWLWILKQKNKIQNERIFCIFILSLGSHYTLSFSEYTPGSALKGTFLTSSGGHIRIPGIELDKQVQDMNLTQGPIYLRLPYFYFIMCAYLAKNKLY